MRRKRLPPSSHILFQGNTFKEIQQKIPEEVQICLYVNGKELTTLMCSPEYLDELALGFLRSEEIISRLEDIASLTISKEQTCVDVWLNKPLTDMPSHRITTTGCGAGVTFDDLLKERQPLALSTSIQPQQIGELIDKLYQSAEQYQETRGVHTAALSDGEELLIVTEDIGQHNTIDRMWGKAMKQGITTQDRILLSTGRITREIIGKAAKAEIPIIISRTAPTSISVALARAWNITIIGYAQKNSFRIYSSPTRVVTS